MGYIWVWAIRIILFKKKSVEKSEEHGSEFVEIAFADLDGWIRKKMEQELEAVKPQLKPIRDRIHVVMNSIRALGSELEKVRIDTQQVADQYLPMMNDARKTLLLTIQKETSEEFAEVRTKDDLLAMRERLSKILNRLGDTGGSHSRIIRMFFGKHAKILKLQLNMLNKESKHLNDIMERYKQMTSELAECSAGACRITTALRDGGDASRKAGELKKELESLKARKVELAKQLKDLQGTEAFRQYTTDKEELGRAKSDAEAVLAEISAAFSRISRPLGKYTYEVGLDKESSNMVQAVMGNPLELVQGVNVEKLGNVLTKVGDAIRSGKVAVKNPAKDIENINLLLKNMQHYIDGYKQHGERVGVLVKKTSFMDADLARISVELERLRSEVAQKETLLSQHLQVVEKSRSLVNSELESIAEKLWNATGAQVKITIQDNRP